MTALMILFVYALSQIFGICDARFKAEAVTKNLICKAVSAPRQKDIPIQIDFDILQQNSEHIVGWIYCENTPIHYPVMQSKDNVFYLNRLPDGSYNAAGSIFLDYRNAPAFTDKLSILHGHNLETDSMFGTLLKYQSQTYYDEHPELYLLTPSKHYRISLFAGCVTTATSPLYTRNDDLFQIICAMTQCSDFTASTTPDEQDQIIALSTCTNDHPDTRYVLLGILQALQ